MRSRYSQVISEGVDLLFGIQFINFKVVIAEDYTSSSGNILFVFSNDSYPSKDFKVKQNIYLTATHYNRHK
jgi:hypothetical protein